jgi:hypothetical protein
MPLSGLRASSAPALDPDRSVPRELDVVFEVGLVLALHLALALAVTFCLD